MSKNRDRQIKDRLFGPPDAESRSTQVHTDAITEIEKTATIAQPTCRHCRFWTELYPNTSETHPMAEGKCRALPPDSGGFGNCRASEWCGQFSAKEDK